MNLVDSSGWLEYFADGPNANFFAAPLEKIEEVIVPTLCIYEVFKRILQQRGENQSLQAVTLMQQARVVELNATIAINAAKLSDQLKLPMADSVILATAKMADAVLWTQDADFKDMKNVKYINKG